MKTLRVLAATLALANAELVQRLTKRLDEAFAGGVTDATPIR